MDGGVVVTVVTVTPPSGTPIITVVSAAGTLVLAIGTAVVAFFTWRTADQTRLSREAEWQPYLVVEDLHLRGRGATAVFRCTLRNMGRGPALRSICVIGYGGAWLASKAISVAHGESIPVVGKTQGKPDMAARLLFSEGRAPRGRGTMLIQQIPVVICQDGVGNWLRFARGTLDVDRKRRKPYWFQRRRHPGWYSAILELPDTLMPKGG